MTKPLWSPSAGRVAASNLAAFMAFLAPRHGEFKDFAALHRWSIADTAAFWSELWDFAGLVGDKGAQPWLADETKMPGAQFFPAGHINYAENALRRAGGTQELVFTGEDKVASRTTLGQVRDDAGRFQRFLKACGINAGDRIAAVLPNLPQSIVALLATTSIGAVWSSCSPDFGAQGIIDRFGQISPRVLIVCDGYYYAGKTLDITDKIIEVLGRVAGVEHVVVVSYLGCAEESAARINQAAGRDIATTYDEALKRGGPGEIAFARLPFNHPMCILYSSGTTGVPKCIVHSTGGMLMKHVSEHILHTDIKPGDRVFYFTTLGWMMWNWLVSGLVAGASLLLYDGSPFHPDAAGLWRMAEREKCTHFGTSAKYIDTLKKQGYAPGEHHDLTPLRALMSTGSPLSAEGFDFIYDAVKRDLHLASISGGTDICGCFVLGNPVQAVWRGEIQSPALGMATDVTDDEGHHLAHGRGELVCRKPFPSMPVGFWNDEDGARYRAAYFERMPGMWHHGDFAEWTEHGGMIIHGRSDATLNPGGVRIGTAEIYRVVENIPEVQEAVAIGQPWENDVRILLFVVMKQGHALDQAMIDTIKRRIRERASPRHVPALVVPVKDIPRTRSGKISELAVRDVIVGREVKNTEALANPEALKQFEAAAWSAHK